MSLMRTCGTAMKCSLGSTTLAVSRQLSDSEAPRHFFYFLAVKDTWPSFNGFTFQSCSGSCSLICCTLRWSGIMTWTRLLVSYLAQLKSG